MTELLTIKKASTWASEYLNKNVTPSNISYLLQYGKIKKYEKQGKVVVNKYDLLYYYDNFKNQRENDWKEKLGEDIHLSLSFNNLTEKETTKHIHRLHPYKGKFIPQLVEYFLDDHIDTIKKEVYFKKGDIVLDPFSGSGTTVIQANELGIHAVGIDISLFNTLISNAKIEKVHFDTIQKELQYITTALQKFIANNINVQFENELLAELSEFNKKYFPSPEYKIQVRKHEINEKEYASAKESEFVLIFDRLQKKYQLTIQQEKANTFLETWYIHPIRKEMDFIYEHIKNIKSQTIKNIITIILSRTIRSCRATAHADLTTLKKPVIQTYYCKKHGKICKPLFSLLSWWKRYSADTIQRLLEFDALRTDSLYSFLQGDAKSIDIASQLHKNNPTLEILLQKHKIKGIFSSPPYVGLIDYHQQHAYAYELFGLKRNDELEIGPLYKGQGKDARTSYAEGVASVLSNAKRYLQKDYNVFLVANDKYNLYPTIAEKANMQIVDQYKRPVLNRTEKNTSAYAETIFHLKEQ